MKYSFFGLILLRCHGSVLMVWDPDVFRWENVSHPAPTTFDRNKWFTDSEMVEHFASNQLRSQIISDAGLV